MKWTYQAIYRVDTPWLGNGASWDERHVRLSRAGSGRESWETIEIQRTELGSRDVDCIGRIVIRPRERARTSQWSKPVTVTVGG